MSRGPYRVLKCRTQKITTVDDSRSYIRRSRFSPSSLEKLNFQFSTHLGQKKRGKSSEQKNSSMAMRREDDVIVVDDDFLSLVEAAEANALSNKRRKIVNGDESISVESTKEKEEGAYTAALKGSKSNLWKQTSFDSGNSRSKGGALKAITNNFSALAESGNSDNGCFKCGKLGHWASDCDAPGGGIGGDRGKLNDSMPVKPCLCGLGSCSVLTANTEKNRGRKFYKCPVREENGGCGFFEWCDNASAIPMSSGVQYSSAKSSFPDLPCPCGVGSCLVLTAKTGQNVGQQFYRCPANQANSCGFFKWCIDRSIGAGYQPSNSHYANTQSSPGTGGSSSCFKLGQGGHLARDFPKPSTPSTGIRRMGSMGAMGGKSAPSGTWGQGGHWAGDFPKPSTPSTGIGRMGNMGAMGGKSASSGTWGQGGQWARDFPKPSTPSTGIGRMGSMGNIGESAPSDTCYKCGKSGHWAKDCAAQDLKFGKGTTRKAPASYSFYR